MLDPSLKAQIIGKSYTELPPELQQTLANELRPSEGFTEEQRSEFKDMYLEVDSLANLNSINAQKPIFQMGAIRHLTKYYLPAELLTDCRSGETYFHARDWLLSLKFAYLEIPVEIL